MRLTHRQLEIFRSLMQTLNVTETAAQLCSSQPTISRELKALEEGLGFILFRRDKRRLEVTPRAIALHVIVQRSFVSLDEIGRAADAIRGDRLQRVSVACLPAFAHALMPQAIRRFRADHPDAQLKVHSIEESVLTRELLNNNFDLGVVEGRVPGGLGSLLHREAGDLLCILPADHPLARHEVIEIGQMAGVAFIYYAEEDTYRRQIDARFDAAGGQPATDGRNDHRHLHRGDGLAWHRHLHRQPADRAGLRRPRPCRPPDGAADPLQPEHLATRPGASKPAERRLR